MNLAKSWPALLVLQMELFWYMAIWSVVHGRQQHHFARNSTVPFSSSSPIVLKYYAISCSTHRRSLHIHAETDLQLCFITDKVCLPCVVLPTIIYVHAKMPFLEKEGWTLLTDSARPHLEVLSEHANINCHSMLWNFVPQAFHFLVSFSFSLPINKPLSHFIQAHGADWLHFSLTYFSTMKHAVIYYTWRAYPYFSCHITTFTFLLQSH